ncbi:STAS domain-containing protein [Streptomyces sp. AM6-12]|uniref:STAS domain-containing protein n=1 Tax=Streptomyces sp. AM6-12 TaxID=3345149 RepID=UPI0037A6D1FA
MTDAQSTDRAPQSAGLSITATTSDGIHVVTLVGEIDHHTAGTLRQALDITASGAFRIVADMRQVTFMDSSGINILISAHHAATTAGGWLRLAAPTAAVLRTLHIVGIDQVIDCLPTLPDALAL